MSEHTHPMDNSGQGYNPLCPACQGRGAACKSRVINPEGTNKGEDIRYWCVQHDVGERKAYSWCSESGYLRAVGIKTGPCEWEMFQKVPIVSYMDRLEEQTGRLDTP